MEVKVATTSLHWSARHAVFPQCPSSSQTLASSKRRRHRREGAGDVSSGGSLACHYPLRPIFTSSAFLGTQSAKIPRSKSCEFWELSKSTATKTMQKRNPLRRVCSASSDFFPDEDFFKHIQELNLKFRISGEEEKEIIHESVDNGGENYRYGTVELLQESVSGLDSVEPPWPEMVNHSTFLRKANSVDLPHSLRIIKRKLQEEGLKEASESTHCSVNRAFSSMVFMIDELNSFTLQMREAALCEKDLQGVLMRVQKDMHASFLWLFQRVFSHTPTLMVHVMILLANFTVHSMGSNTAISAAATPLPADGRVKASPISGVQDQTHQNLDSSSLKMFNVSPSSKTTSTGGGGKLRPAFSGEDGNDWFDRSEQYKPILPDGVAHLSTIHDKSIPGGVITEGELRLWNSMVEEAERMQDSAIDRETRRRLVSPVEAKIELDDYDDFVRTEVLYQMCLAEEPNNPLLLANYAQFLYLVTQDYDRAEEYFKRATGARPGDAEAYNKYANFLWRGRNDLWGAEEKFLEAMTVDPTNPYYAGNYANFLWNTGGEETCFPLGSPQEKTQEML